MKGLNFVPVCFAVPYTMFPIPYTLLLEWPFASLYSIYSMPYTPTIQVYFLCLSITYILFFWTSLNGPTNNFKKN